MLMKILFTVFLANKKNDRFWLLQAGPWSLLTIHMISEHSFQFLWELYNGQQRPCYQLHNHLIRKSLCKSSNYIICTNDISEKN
jgi:hypothetical protein